MVNIEIMQKIFQRAKGLIGLSLATLLLFISTLTIAPAPAKANNCVGVCPQVNLDSGDEVAFAAGVVTGILFSSGGATAATTTAATAATTVATAVASVAAAPIVAPLAFAGGIVAGGYLLFSQVGSQSQPLEYEPPAPQP